MNKTSNSDVNDDEKFSISTISLTFIFGFTICITSLAAIIILNKCKKIVEQIRITSIQLCVANFSFGLTIVANSVYLFKTRMLCAVLFKLLPSFLLTYFLFLSFTGIDRLLSLTLSLRYNFWMRRRNIYLITGAIYVIAIGFGIVLNFQPKAMFQCQLERGDNFMSTGISIFVTTMFILMVTSFVCFICIGCIAAKKSFPGPFKKANAYATFWRVTMKIIKLGTASFVLVVPYTVIRLQRIITRDAGNAVAIGGDFLHSGSGLLLFVHQVLSPVFILVSYHECRYVILHAICCCSDNWRQRVRHQYIQQYSSYEIASGRVAPLPLKEEDDRNRTTAM